MRDVRLRVHRTHPEPYVHEARVRVPEDASVLDALLALKECDGTLGLRHSCNAAICGSCGMRVNGAAGLACATRATVAAAHARDGVIEVEPLGNMPVVKDLIVDMDAVHWRKVGQVRPWLDDGGRTSPEREHVVDHEAMLDVGESQACIQCGACVSDCLSLEVDPGFLGPAALAKAHRFVADPRDAAHRERLDVLAHDPGGLYDCTHCFMCVDRCPKDVAPMNQIMRLRRAAAADHGITDTTGHRHEQGFVDIVRSRGLLHEADLLVASHGGRLSPATGREVIESLPLFARALLRGKVTVQAVAGHPHRAPAGVRRIVDLVEGRPRRVEVRLRPGGVWETAEEHGVPSGSDAAEGPQSSRHV